VRRRRFIGLAATVAVAAPLAARAQKGPPLPHIGILTLEGSRSHPELDAFEGGLAALDYVEGGNIVIERGMADFHIERLPSLAAELVAHDVAVIVALQPLAVDAARTATRTIPIVARVSDDPVRAGVVASLSRPGGNLTGVSSSSAQLVGKRLELLKELTPGMARVGLVRSPGLSVDADALEPIEDAAAKLGLATQSFAVRRADDIAPVFAAAKAAGVGALMPLRSPFIVGHRTEIAAAAAAQRLPAIYDEREFCEAGGLISYGADLNALHRRLAYFVDRILKGAKPADLPVEQPTVFELVVSLKAAKALGLTVPPTLLARADAVIEDR
jgi:putative ABC transport system substrate-binding protein